MDQSQTKRIATALSVAGLLLIVASAPALWFTTRTAGSLSLAAVTERQHACESRLSQALTPHKLTTTADTLNATLTLDDNATLSAHLNKLKSGLLFCTDYELTTFCAGDDCSTPGLTFTLKKR